MLSLKRFAVLDMIVGANLEMHGKSSRVTMRLEQSPFEQCMCQRAA
jgi:hypothetical protein